MQLTNKKILIISPQFWGKMFISKHHYAVELALRGNEIYFLNPPNANLNQEFFVDENEVENLYVIHHKLNFSYKLKFRSEWLFHLFMKKHINKMLNHLKIEFDIVWSFDIGNLYPLKFFQKKSIKIFHPVDEPNSKTAIKSAVGCDIIFSTTNEIINKYRNNTSPKYLINHGLKQTFIEQEAPKHYKKNLKIGFSGNLLRNDIDREILLKIIQSNKNLEFNCWGSFNIQQSNISGGTDEETKVFIRSLKALPNVILHGVKNTNQLAQAYQQMNAFLICYKVINNPLIGENYHKTLEFISTGKVIISHNFSSYRDKSDFVIMDIHSKNNNHLPELFKQIIANIEYYNTPELATKRKEFCIDNLYQKQIDRIKKHLEEHF